MFIIPKEIICKYENLASDFVSSSVRCESAEAYGCNPCSGCGSGGGSSNGCNPCSGCGSGGGRRTYKAL